MDIPKILFLVLDLLFTSSFAFYCFIRYKFRKKNKLIHEEAARQNRILACFNLTQYGIFKWRWSDCNHHAIFGGTSLNSILVFDVFGKEIGELIPPIPYDSFSVTEEEVVLSAAGTKTAYPFRDIRWFGSNRPFFLPETNCDRIELARKRRFLVATANGRKRILHLKPLILWNTLCIMALLFEILWYIGLFGGYWR